MGMTNEEVDLTRSGQDTEKPVAMLTVVKDSDGGTQSHERDKVGIK
jgi:hypothetical protein